MSQQPQKADFARAIREAEKIISDNYIERPPVRVFELPLNYGLMVTEVEIPGTYQTVSGFINIENQVIVLNKLDHVNRQAFTVAHELGHWLLHRDRLDANPDLGILYRAPLGGQIDPIEQEANTFAANLLVPDKLLREYISEPADRIARIFGVSEDVIRYRLASLRRR